MGKEMKLSFSLPSKSSSSSRPNPTKRPQDPSASSAAANGDDSKPQFVTHFDPSQTLASAAGTKIVIPPIPNSDFRTTKRMKNLIIAPLDEEVSSSDGSRFVVDTTSGPDPSSISYGLTLRSSSNGAAGEAEPENDEDPMLRRFKYDMKTLPDDRGMEEFEEVPVEGFGAAILAGYGWTEGKGIGRNSKGDTKVVQYDRRAGTEGLGFVPGPDDPKHPRRKGHQEVVNQEKKPEPEPVLIMRIVSGRHEGLKGEVLRKSRSDGIVLRLLRSGEEVTVGKHMVAELGSLEEEECLKRLKELKIHNGRDRKREEKRGREEAKEGNKSQQNRSSGRGGWSPVQWLQSNIRVRVISKDLRGGKLYCKKGVVVDVVGPTTCDILMDEGKELVQGVDQEILETALPKHGGSVLVLYGKHKGVYGSLEERDIKKETGVVKDADNRDLINVRLEQIAEYVGDPSNLGY